MRNGECWEQQTLAQTIKGTESGLWPTPTICGNYNQKGMSKTSADGLATMVKMFPTPNARDWKDTDKSGNRKSPGLGVVAHWPTPRAFMYKDSTTDRGKFNLGEKVGGSLNPNWVEWLMGWPLGWTDLKPLEMDKSHSVQQQHGES